MAHRVPHIRERLVIDVFDDDMQAVIDGNLRIGIAPRAGDRRQRRIRAGLQRKVDDRRRAAERGRPGAALEGIAGDGRAYDILEMHVGVDAPRQHVKSRGVHDAHIRTHLDATADGADHPVVHQDVGGVVVDGRDDAAVADQCCRHGRTSSSAAVNLPISSAVL